jgi:hypothetical protein
MGTQIDLYEFQGSIVSRAGTDDLDTLLRIGREKAAFLVDVRDMPPEWKEEMKESRPELGDDDTIMVVVQ